MPFISVKISKTARVVGILFCISAIIAYARYVRALFVYDPKVEALSPIFLTFIFLSTPLIVLMIAPPCLIGGYPKCLVHIIPRKILLYFGLNIDEFKLRVINSVAKGESLGGLLRDLDDDFKKINKDTETKQNQDRS